jgi:glycine oxidase
MPLSVVIIGGGIMGSASGLSLARRGATVTVLERAVPGAEASSAAAGILGAQAEAHGPSAETDLLLHSRALYPAFARELQAATGIDVGYRPSGVVRVALADEADTLREANAWQAATPAATPIEWLTGAGLREIEPQLSAELTLGARFVDDAQIDPPKLFRAVQIAATRAGVTFRPGTQVARVVIENERAVGVLLADGSTVRADVVVLAAGSWSSLVAGVDLPSDAVIPARGQVVELSLRMPPLRHVIFGKGVYLVPRDDGRVLLGATLEFVGYTKEVTAKGLRDLLNAATTLCPALEEAQFNGAWSSFRPFAKEGRVLLGASSVKGLVYATGHHRNGILLAPLTAEAVTAACFGEPYEVPSVTR